MLNLFLFLFLTVSTQAAGELADFQSRFVDALKSNEKAVVSKLFMKKSRSGTCTSEQSPASNERAAQFLMSEIRALYPVKDRGKSNLLVGARVIFDRSTALIEPTPGSAVVFLVSSAKQKKSWLADTALSCLASTARQDARFKKLFE